MITSGCAGRGRTILRRVTSGLLERARRELRESPAAPAGVVALAVILFWSARDGATDPLVWAPGSLLLVALLVVVAVTAPGSPPGGRAGILALAAFAGFTGWCFLSILWADVEADAWSGATKTLAYFAVYALFAIRRWRARPAAAFLGAYALGVTAIGVWELASIARADRPTLGFLEGRLAEPITYANGNCALYLAAAIPALHLAARRDVAWVLRGVFLASAGLLAELALLCQSRMSLFAVPFVLIAYFLVIPGRLRSLLALTCVGVVVALAGPRLLAVYEAVIDEVGAREAVTDARAAMLWSAVALFVAGVAWALLDRRWELPVRVTRALGIGAAVLVVAATVAAGAAFAERYGNPVDQAEVWWDRFKGDEYVSDPGTPHIVSGFGGAGRYDAWRVAGSLFVDHPVTGIGVDNFSVDFLRERTIDDNPLYPHSLPLRMLQQVGLVGTALFALFTASMLVAGWGALRRGPPEARGIAGAALLLFVYWLVHGAVDWLWEIPALSAAAFAAAGLFVALAPSQPRTRGRWWAPIAGGTLALVALVSVGSAWLSAREIDVAVRSWRATPAAAYEHLERARSFDPFSDQPDVLGAVIAAQRNDVGRQQRLLLRALERNPHNWYPYLELGLIDARQGRQAVALRRLEHARALNPREDTIRYAVEHVRSGDPPSQAEMDERFVRSVDNLTGARQ